MKDEKITFSATKIETCPSGLPSRDARRWVDVRRDGKKCGLIDMITEDDRRELWTPVGKFTVERCWWWHPVMLIAGRRTLRNAREAVVAQIHGDPEPEPSAEERRRRVCPECAEITFAEEGRAALEPCPDCLPEVDDD